MSATATAPLLKGKRILIAKPGLDGHDIGAKVIALALRDAGAEVIYTGLRKTPDYIARIAVDEDVDAVGLSVLSGSHRDLVQQTRASLEAIEAGDIPLFLGGTIPEADWPELFALGVKKIYTSEMKLADVVASIAETLKMSGPLSGIRILEIGHMLAGPYCGLLLGDLGADVIKIEPPTGDIARNVSPNFIGKHNEYFASLNRNKRSVIVDLGSKEGQAQLHALAKSAHALVTNLRPSAIRKLGLTYDALKTVNPKLVCLALTGFGIDSPYADRPAYDYVIQAMTGVMQLTGEPDAPPTKTGYSAVDNSAGMMGALGLVAKLVEGKGGQIDVAMYDVMLSQLNYIAAAWLNSGAQPRRYAHSAHPYMVPAQIFPTAQGWLTLFITHDDFWRRFAEEAGQPQWLVDPKYATMEARRANRDEVIAAIAGVLQTSGAKNWMDRLVPLGVVAAEVSSLESALISEQTVARNMVVEIATDAGAIRAIGNPMKFSGATETFAAPPLLGEHNDLLHGGAA